MIKINCCVCGKEYEIGNNEHHRMWCSVACQYGEEFPEPNEKLTKALEDLRKFQEQAQEIYNEAADQFWNSLSKENQLQCFYSVVKRIYKAEIEQKSSYRYVLYDVFGFGPEAYSVGMSCGYHAIHNGLYDLVNKEKEDGT